MLARLQRLIGRARSEEAGFTLIELVVVAAVLALLVALALPSYLGARNKAALDEANGMAQEWRSLTYGCYLQFLSPSSCASNADVGFNEVPGKYWNWTTPTGATTPNYSVVTASNEIVVSWASNSAGLENGVTYTVTLFYGGAQQGQSSSGCIPSGGVNPGPCS